MVIESCGSLAQLYIGMLWFSTHEGMELILMMEVQSIIEYKIFICFGIKYYNL